MPHYLLRTKMEKTQMVATCSLTDYEYDIELSHWKTKIKMTTPTNPTSRERPRTGAGIRGATGEMILSRTPTLTVSFSSLHLHPYVLIIILT